MTTNLMNGCAVPPVLVMTPVNSSQSPAENAMIGVARSRYEMPAVAVQATCCILPSTAESVTTDAIAPEGSAPTFHPSDTPSEFVSTRNKPLPAIRSLTSVAYVASGLAVAGNSG